MMPAVRTPAPVRPRDWIEPAPFPWASARALRAGEPFAGCYCLVELHHGRTKQDKPYLKLQLYDRHGRLEARVWDDAEPASAWLREGGYVGVRGRIEIFNGERQLNVETMVPLDVADHELALFMPHSPREPKVMERELRTRIASIRDGGLRAIVAALLDPTTDSGRRFRTAPAAKHNHHAYLGGLLEHSLSVAAVCDQLAAHYGADIDRDLLVAAALIHDIGKTLEIEPCIGFPYTDEGKLLGHILLGLRLITRVAPRIAGLPAERLRLLEHLVASHQGRYEWQSPREPRTLEALVLHYVDDLDAKMHQAAALVRSVPEGWTAYARSFGRDFFRHRGTTGEPAAPSSPQELAEAAERPEPLDLFGA